MYEAPHIYPDLSERLSRYIATYYFDKALIVLYETSGGVSIISFSSIIGAPVGIAIASFSFTRIVKKILKATRNKKKKRK